MNDLVKRINELKHERAKLIADARQYMDKATAEKREKTAEEQAKWDTIHADADKLQVRIAEMERQLDAERSVTDIVTPEAPAQDADKRSKAYRAFEKWIRCGQKGLTAEDRALLARGESRTTVGPLDSGTSGDELAGYTIPSGGLAPYLEEAMLAFGGILSTATVMHTGSGETMYLPSVNDTGNGSTLVTEGTEVTGNTHPQFARTQLDSYMYVSDILRVTFQLLRDSKFDIAGYVQRALMTRLARGMNTQCTTADGSDKPHGLASATYLGVTTASATAITADEIIDLVYSVDKSYRSVGKFTMADATCKLLRKLKDGEGRYLFQPSAKVGDFDTLFGYPVVWNNDMPAATAGLISVAFGDMSKYIIRLVGDPTVVRMDEKYVEYLEVGFMAFHAFDGDLLDAGTRPIKHIIMHS